MVERRLLTEREQRVHKALPRAARGMDMAVRALRSGRADDALTALLNAAWIARYDANELRHTNEATRRTRA